MQYAPLPTPEQLDALANAIAPGGAICFDRRIEGGLGCTMDVLRVKERNGAEFRTVLRRRMVWAEPHNADIDASSEFKVLGHLRRHGVPAPEPVWFDEDDVFEQPAMVVSFIEGAPLLAPDDPLAYAEQFALALVKLHGMPLTDEIASALTDFNALENRLMAADSPPRNAAGHSLGQELWEAQKADLERTPLAKPVFVHSDYWPGNTMWRDQQLVAIVDMEEVGLGDPAIDVGTAVVNLWYEEWGRPAAERFIGVYRAETGRRLETLRYWMLRELRKPMPDIARWLPSFQSMSSRPDITADELRAVHSGLIHEVLDKPASNGAST